MELLHQKIKFKLLHKVVQNKGGGGDGNIKVALNLHEELFPNFEAGHVRYRQNARLFKYVDRRELRLRKHFTHHDVQKYGVIRKFTVNGTVSEKDLD